MRSNIKMEKITLLVCALILSACGMVPPDVAMKIEKSSSDFEILIGEFDGSLALIHGDPTNAKIHVTNGELNCDGTSTVGKFTTDMRTNKVSHLFHIICNDGRTGQLPLTIKMKSDLNAHGIGVGKMSDGSKVKVLVGDMAATISW